jgi:hypothetical protein
MWIIRPNKSRDKRFVALIVSDDYPLIGVSLKDAENNPMKLRNIYCHMIVAFKYRADLPISEGTRKYLESAGLSESYFATSPMTDVEFSNALKNGGLVIMHADDDKSNYRLSNLKIGTISENGFDRHDNLTTTSRKRVKLIVVVSGEFQIFGSHNEAAAFLGVSFQVVSNAATFNRTREIAEYRKTKSKKTDMKYYIVDAA